MKVKRYRPLNRLIELLGVIFLIPHFREIKGNFRTKIATYLFMLLRYRILAAGNFLRGMWVAAIIKLGGGKCGWIFVDRHFSLRSIPHKGIQIGNDVAFGPNVKVLVLPGGELKIGDGCRFTSDIFISASDSIEIGKDCLIAEFTSIRDADHRCFRGKTIRKQPMVSDPVYIGSDVWIGRGVAILKGSTIGSGSVVGANAVVKSDLDENSINVGVPARTIKYRPIDARDLETPEDVQRYSELYVANRESN